MWPRLAYSDGACSGFARWVFVRAVWYVQRSVPGRERLSLGRTRERLEEGLRELIIQENAAERLRRAVNMTNWILQGLVTTPALAREVAEYERRGRTGEEEEWREIVAESAAHSKAVQTLIAHVESQSGGPAAALPWIGPDAKRKARCLLWDDTQSFVSRPDNGSSVGLPTAACPSADDVCRPSPQAAHAAALPGAGLRLPMPQLGRKAGREGAAPMPAPAFGAGKGGGGGPDDPTTPAAVNPAFPLGKRSGAGGNNNKKREQPVKSSSGKRKNVPAAGGAGGRRQ